MNGSDNTDVNLILLVYMTNSYIQNKITQNLKASDYSINLKNNFE
jgi:hypothetical protein